MWCWWPMTCESKTKPSCDWSDPDGRSELVDGLVTDGLALIEAVNNMELTPNRPTRWDCWEWSRARTWNRTQTGKADGG